MLGKIEGRRRRRQHRTRCLDWHHQLNGHECERTLGDSEKTGKPGVLQFTGLQRIGHNLATEQGTKSHTLQLRVCMPQLRPKTNKYLKKNRSCCIFSGKEPPEILGLSHSQAIGGTAVRLSGRRQSPPVKHSRIECQLPGTSTSAHPEEGDVPSSPSLRKGISSQGK